MCRLQPQKQADGKPDEVGTLLKLLLEKYVVSPNPHIKQAACIWLVALVRKCGDSGLVQKRLKDTQSAFMDLLSQNDGETGLVNCITQGRHECLWFLPMYSKQL